MPELVRNEVTGRFLLIEDNKAFPFICSLAIRCFYSKPVNIDPSANLLSILVSSVPFNLIGTVSGGIYCLRDGFN